MQHDSDTTRQLRRGGSPVGLVADLDAVEAGAVLCLRLWCGDASTRVQVGSDLSSALGAAAGRQALGALDGMCRLCAGHGRRPILHHQVGCACLGADEACFARIVGAASDGDREDAALIATLMVRPDFAMTLAGHAETLGLALRRMAVLTESLPARGERVH